MGNRLVSINLSEGRSIRFEYDKAGRRTVMRLPNGTETRYSYDAAGQVLNVEHRNASDTLAFARYGYDKAGNRVSKVDNAGEHIYGYDQLSRLTDVSVTGAVGKRSEHFAYDAVGNRTEDNLYKGYKYDAANRLLENTAYSYTYDANGNLTGRTDKADNSVSKYSYNADNKLVRVEMPEGVVVVYTYDAGGRRIERTVSKAGTETVTRYVYDGENIIAELDKDGNPTEIFTNGPGIDEPLIMKKADGSEYYYHADALGSITALSDGKGQIAERMAYTAYGLPTRYNAKGEFIENSAIGNTRTYTAREQDDDTGLYYYRARYYDAETGRFTQEDPIGFKGGNVNFYAYVVDSPIRKYDPSGLVTDEQLANHSAYSNTAGPTTALGINSHGAAQGGCQPLQDLIAYEQEHGTIGVLISPEYSSFNLSKSSRLPSLSGSYDSLYGPVHADWMLRSALGGLGIVPAVSTSFYGVAKPAWNMANIAYYKENDGVFAQMGHKEYANSPIAAWSWLVTSAFGDSHHMLEALFEPALDKCKAAK